MRIWSVCQPVLYSDRIIADISGLSLLRYKCELSWICIECGKVSIAGCTQVVVARCRCCILVASILCKWAFAISRFKGWLNIYSVCREVVIVRATAVNFLLWAIFESPIKRVVGAWEPTRFDTWVVLERHFVDQKVISSIGESLGVSGQLFTGWIASEDRSIQSFIRAARGKALLPFDFIVSARHATRHISERDKFRPIGPS